MLYITSPWLIYFITGGFKFPSPITPTLPLPSSLVTTHLFSVLMSMFLFGLLFRSPHVSEIIFVFVCLVSLCITPLGSIHVVANGKMPFSGWVTFHCMHKPHFLYPFIWWILRPLPYLASVNNVTVNIGYIHLFELVFLFSSSKYPEIKIAWSCDSSIFSFLQEPPVIFSNLLSFKNSVVRQAKHKEDWLLSLGL